MKSLEKISEKEKARFEKELQLAMKEKGTNFRDIKRTSTKTRN